MYSLMYENISRHHRIHDAIVGTDKVFKQLVLSVTGDILSFSQSNLELWDPNKKVSFF